VLQIMRMPTCGNSFMERHNHACAMRRVLKSPAPHRLAPEACRRRGAAVPSRDDDLSTTGTLRHQENCDRIGGEDARSDIRLHTIDCETPIGGDCRRLEHPNLRSEAPYELLPCCAK